MIHNHMGRGTWLANDVGHVHHSLKGGTVRIMKKIVPDQKDQP